MCIWNTVRLGDIVETNTNSYSNADNWEYVNYLDTGSITENNISEIQKIDLKSEKLPSRAKRKVKLNSIVFSTVRPNQRHYGIIKHIPDNFLVSTGFTVIDVNDCVDADYLYFWLSQDKNIEHLHAIAEQSVSAYPSIKATDIENLMIDLPPVDIQRRIAKILMSLTQKMEENQRINSNLCLQSAA